MWCATVSLKGRQELRVQTDPPNREPQEPLDVKAHPEVSQQQERPESQVRLEGRGDRVQRETRVRGVRLDSLGLSLQTRQQG